MSESPQTHVVTIGELALVCPGYSARPEERRPRGKYLLIGGRNIKDGRLVSTEKDSYIDDISKDSFRRAIAQPGDIIVSTLFDRRKLYIYRETDPSAVVNSSCAIIRAPDKNDYILSYLRTLKGQEQFLREAAAATGGGFIPRLSIRELTNILVPLLPLSQLQRLGDTHIEASTTKELIVLGNELRSKDAEIQQLKEQIDTLRGKDEEIERLQAQLTQVTSYYEDRLRKIESQISTNDLRSRIGHGETSKFEFKSSLRWNSKANRFDPAIELAILKTIVAFCNTEGGEMLIGVADDHTIIGIEQDRFPNEDRFLLHLTNLVNDKIIPSVVNHVDYEIVTLDYKRICRVLCKQSKEDVWLKPERNKPGIFYVRSGPSSKELHDRDAIQYIREHFQK